jgi:DNA mismatch repair ATPase MutS
MALYQMRPGVCPKSYGMSVALAAGVPQPVVSYATAIAARFFEGQFSANPRRRVRRKLLVVRWFGIAYQSCRRGRPF